LLLVRPSFNIHKFYVLQSAPVSCMAVRTNSGYLHLRLSIPGLPNLHVVRATKQHFVCMRATWNSAQRTKNEKTYA